MKSRDGVSKQFRFYVIDKDTGISTPYLFSFKHKKLTQSRTEWWRVSRDIGGVHKQKAKYLHRLFRIDWSDLMDGEDADKYNIVDNAEKQGHRLKLQPHIDTQQIYEVFSVKDSDGTRKVVFTQTVNSRNSLGNEGTVVDYITVYPTYDWAMVNPSNQQSVSALGFEEFI
jgi:hypothetical protein